MTDAIDPAALRLGYSRFLRVDRVLLTGHSHQAWPDTALDGVLRAFDDAAEHVDDKWQRASEMADRVRGEVTQRIGGAPEQIALGGSTHELVSRFLTALDWSDRRHLVTTSGEFHSMRRQLARLAEAGVEVSFVDCDPLESLAERVGAAVRADTAAVMLSTVLFETSAQVPHLEAAVQAARRVGAEVLLDAYHAFNVVPFSWDDYLEAFVTGGGYKYAQWGEGCCFLGVPAGCQARPIYTGWFADFASLDAAPGAAAVGYGARGADRFAGATYDPTSHYRAVAVAEYFRKNDLSVARLRALSVRQSTRLIAGLDGYRILSPLDSAARGGFVAIGIDRAPALAHALRERNICVDARGEVLRLGPAPYVLDDEIDQALAVLRELSPPR